MTEPIVPAKPRSSPWGEHFTVAAVLAYLAVFLLSSCGFRIFELIIWKVSVSDVMVGVLSAFLAQVYGFANLGIGYHLGSSAGAKTANAALAQKAGVGPPPPAAPLTPSESVSE